MHWLVGLAMLTAACQAPVQGGPTSDGSGREVQSPVRTGGGEAFSIRLPEGAEMIHRPSGMDFETYRVVLAGRELAGVYVGMAPDTRDWATDTGPNPSRTVRADGGQERVWRTACRGWPSHIHVWAAPDARDMTLANTVVRSLALADCPP